MRTAVVEEPETLIEIASTAAFKTATTASETATSAAFENLECVRESVVSLRFARRYKARKVDSLSSKSDHEILPSLLDPLLAGLNQKRQFATLLLFKQRWELLL